MESRYACLIHAPGYSNTSNTQLSHTPSTVNGTHNQKKIPSPQREKHVLENILPVILKRLKTIYIQYSDLHPGIDILPNRFINLINKPGRTTKNK